MTTSGGATSAFGGVGDDGDTDAASPVVCGMTAGTTPEVEEDAFVGVATVAAEPMSTGGAGSSEGAVRSGDVRVDGLRLLRTLFEGAGSRAVDADAEGVVFLFWLGIG